MRRRPMRHRAQASSGNTGELRNSRGADDLAAASRGGGGWHEYPAGAVGHGYRNRYHRAEESERRHALSDAPRTLSHGRIDHPRVAQDGCCFAADRKPDETSEDCTDEHSTLKASGLPFVWRGVESCYRSERTCTRPQPLSYRGKVRGTARA